MKQISLRDNVLKLSTMVATTILILVGVCTVTVKADSINETEPNDTIATAQMILANSETPAGAISGTFAGKHTINGHTSNTDADCFEVYLYSGTNYITLNANYTGDSVNYSVQDQNGIEIGSGTYIKAEYGPTADIINVATSGYYYVVLDGNSTSSIGYLFSIGTPTYNIYHTTIACTEGTINMVSGGGNQTGTFNGLSVANIPDDAIAYSVVLQNVGSIDAKSVQLTNNNTNTTINLNKYTWDKSGLVNLNLPVASGWTAEFAYYRACSFTPSLRVNYVYPVINGWMN